MRRCREYLSFPRNETGRDVDLLAAVRGGAVFSSRRFKPKCFARSFDQLRLFLSVVGCLVAGRCQLGFADERSRISDGRSSRADFSEREGDERALDRDLPNQRRHLFYDGVVVMWKTLLFLVLALTAAGLGNIALSEGMQSVGPPQVHTFFSLFDYFASCVRNPFVILGILLELTYFIFWLLVLSEADVSWAVPMNAVEYIFVALLAVFLLGEKVTPGRWIGIALISAGCYFMMRSRKEEPNEHTAGETLFS